MTTKSKINPLTIIILIAVLMFIAAAIWKTTHVDNSEEVYIPPVKKDTSVSKNRRIDTSKEVTVDLNQEERISPEEWKKKQSKLMNKHMSFRSPEEVMDTIIRLQELGREDDADEYIDFLLMRYPDYEMPK